MPRCDTSQDPKLFPAPAKKTEPECPCKPITSIEITSLTFRSDHDLLKNHTSDWKDAGPRFKKPEWTPAIQRRVTHSMDKKVVLEIELEVKPAKACVEKGTIRGAAPGGLVFERKNVSFKSGKVKLQLTSDKPLEKKVETLNFQIQWSSEGTKTPLSSSTSNWIFVTIDTPRDSGDPKHGVTLLRMRKAVSLVHPMDTTNPHTILQNLMEKVPNYVLSADPNVPEKYHHPQYFNEEGGAWPMADFLEYCGECQAIVRFVRKIIKQIGAPGDAKMVFVYAKPSTPTVAEEDAEDTPLPALHAYPGYALVDNAVTAANIGEVYPPPHTEMEDHSISMGINVYEACLKFTAKDGPEGKSGPNTTNYYPGGTRGAKHDNKDQVLKGSFFALVQYVSAWYPDENDPDKLLGFKIVAIKAIYPH